MFSHRYTSLVLAFLGLLVVSSCASTVTINPDWDHPTPIHVEIEGTRINFTSERNYTEGYVIYWSLSQEPSPSEDGSVQSLALSAQAPREAELWGFDGMGQYYIRVAGLVNGSPVDFSNQVDAYLPPGSPSP